MNDALTSLQDEILAYADQAATDPNDRAFNPRDLRRAFRSSSGASVGDILRALGDLFDEGNLHLTARGEFERTAE